MNFIADLHIHSRYSMATSRSLGIAELAFWAARKGITVLASGDFTHPAWRKELAETLKEDDNNGLYSMIDQKLPGARQTRFMLGTEISCICKKGGKTRKVHNLVYAPNFETADKIAARLAAIGRMDADGRPILKLDSRDLLEIILEADSRCVLIPAHVWTPWYSLFGSRSGFDNLRDCYEDLSGHIFALETGLSSDPGMNRLWGMLDEFALVSNSDAHSGANLGREANIFSGEPAWDGIFSSLRQSARRDKSDGCQFLGTLEFFPEEGKYHLDGHRKCGISLTPAESRALGNICPVCGKPLTIGVLHRITELADRKEPAVLPGEPGYASLVPLAAIVAEILGVGAQSRMAQNICEGAFHALGSELEILCSIKIGQIRDWWQPLGEAIWRMRQGKIDIQAGFDGQYGKISLFNTEELQNIRNEPPPFKK